MKTILCTGGINGDVPTDLSHYDLFGMITTIFDDIVSDCYGACSCPLIFCSIGSGMLLALLEMNQFIPYSHYANKNSEGVARELWAFSYIRFIAGKNDIDKEMSTRGVEVHN